MFGAHIWRETSCGVRDVLAKGLYIVVFNPDWGAGLEGEYLFQVQ